MDFESPDVEKDFPGLYASESVKKCNESDFSDENHDKSFKKELIIGKRKDKKDSKKDRGYAALEGESSPDEDDSKSPSKSKKVKAFKFPTKKSEKREKSREKDVKEKEKEPEKEKKKEKDKKEKEKVKHKEKKKNKHEDSTEPSEGYPVFGVDLASAVERTGCLDGVPIPLVVRNCIDCIHSSGLTMDGLYKITGVKSKVQSLRKSYNLREPVALGDGDVPVATCLLRTFLRELPEPILTNDLLTRFEEAGAIMEVGAREIELQNLLKQLPHYNRILLAWLIIHFDTVTLHEKHNKLNAQSIAMTFSPVLQMSHRLLTAFLCHCKALFPDVIIEKYVPPLCAGSSFPENPEELAIELKKQELLLNQIHKEMSEGFVSKKREELLWEVQRIVTQFKRKLKSLQRSQEANIMQKSMEDEHLPAEENNLEISKKVEDKKEAVELPAPQDDVKIPDNNQENKENINHHIINNNNQIVEKDNSGKSSPEKIISEKSSPELSLDDLKSQIEHEHLVKFQATLKERIENERSLIERLRVEIQNCRRDSDSLSDNSSNESTPPCVSPASEARMDQLAEENQKLKQKRNELVRRIVEQKLACIKLKTYISLLELRGRGD